ncbi:cytochrome P450 (plasmid) [Rhodococcus erythropolis PR4]|uniref:Cytochrome P450 n=2 Tax=Rhodococcus erythropolis TaxID=1833 RepID=Q3L917_RHOE4|nr:cytochrome P450 [Rhodococcus erythropolis PR4]
MNGPRGSRTRPRRASLVNLAVLGVVLVHTVLMSADKCPYPKSATRAGEITAVQPQVFESIPSPAWRLPLLGDLLTVDSEKPIQKEMALASKLGPIFEWKIVNNRVTVVSGVDLVAEVNNEALWAKSVGLPILKLRKVAEDGLFTAFNSEPNWRKAHNILSEGFSRSALRNYHPSMLRALGGLTDSWDRVADAGETIDASSDANKLALDVIGLAGFGYDFASFIGEEHPFVGAMSRVLAHVNSTSNDIPFLRKLRGNGADLQNEKDIALLRTVVDNVIAERQSKPGEHQDDLLDLMLHSADAETGEKLDPVNIRNQVFTFLVAGNETTAGTLAFALYFLSRHPDVADTARAEVADVTAGETPAFEDVARMRYLRRVVDETLRLWPSAPGYFRKVRTDTTLGGRYDMPKGSWVFVLLPQLHRDPVWGEDPESFDPDRFKPENVKKRPAHAYRPFGTGPRACIGRQFALHEAVLALAIILQRYNFQSDPEYKLDIRETLSLKPVGFELSLQRR